ncbi:hypothetical protein KUTeg_000602 [Tegillarca granosa]|uniref:Uncharacterized protein n=1 Tax=Tegillarca granosa TaxID=220873 RepID=A0ABQ9FY18_TEGGR|nr:hypothetical protein KUTeg_000602 [Tegillarca granosa]
MQSKQFLQYVDAMTTPQKMQHYMERHRLGPLFEDLMNKVLHDQPDDPLVYVIKLLYKKAVRRSKSPELARKSTTQAWASGSAEGLVGKEKGYEKPWLAYSKKVRPKSPEKDVSKSAVRKSKTTSWNPDTKTASTFDDIWQESQQEDTKHVLKTEAGANVRNAWASIGLGGYRGPRTRKDDDDPLAGELMPSKGRSSSKEETTVNTSSGHVRGPRYDTRRHQQKLEQLLQDSDKHSTDSGYIDDQDQEEDEAIELLEDAEELKKEGARHIKPSGYKLSRILKQRQQDANVKLNINLYTGPMPGDGLEGDNRYSSLPEGSLYDSDQEDRPATGMSGYQRRPLWNIDDSDGESYKPKPSRTLPEPSRSKGGISENRKMAATVPGASMHRSTQESVRSETGGWNIPRYESDTSITEYTMTGKGRRPPPKAY